MMRMLNAAAAKVSNKLLQAFVPRECSSVFIVEILGHLATCHSVRLFVKRLGATCMPATADRYHVKFKGKFYFSQDPRSL